MILYPNSESAVKTAADDQFRILSEAADSVQVVADVAITEYVRFRLREYRKAGGQLKAFANKAKLAISAPSQVLSGKLGVGSRTAPRYAAGFDLTVAELYTLAEQYSHKQKVATLTTEASVLGQKCSTSHEAAMKYALAYGISPLTIAKVNVAYLHIAGAPQWDVPKWSELFKAQFVLDKGFEPERLQEMRAETDRRDEAAKKRRRRRSS